MASSLQLTSFLLLIAAVAMLISPATSQTCRSQTFTQSNTSFANCIDLPALRAHLHWTYNPTARPDPTLNIAFIAPPARPTGWVAWALNPTGTGMIGAQSLIAFRDTNGSVVVRTYNITAYSGITESRISYEVLNRRGEFSDGMFTIFATIALPGGGADLNQVWQVGSSVSGGVPVRHDFAPENLRARSTLQLVTSAADDGNRTPAPAPTNGGGSGGSGGSGGPTRSPGGGNDTGGSGRILGSTGSKLGLYGVLVLLGVLVLGF